MMGGHGFSAYSKMGALYSNNDVNNTWEGENNVLIQQTTKYVLDNFQKALQGKEIKSPLLKFLATVTLKLFSLRQISLWK
jgi:acyl-CoA oxidase